MSEPFRQKQLQRPNSDIFEGSIDNYKVLHLEHTTFPQDINIFEKQLTASLQFYKTQNIKAIWMKLKKQELHLASSAIKQGFQIHHGEKEYLMLAKWLREGQENTLPQYATHLIGCGGVVINDNNEILLVQEKQGYKKNFFNIPSGRCDVGETLVNAAIREVEEETSLKTEYFDLLAIREVQQTLFGKPDIYFAFLLKVIGKYDVKIQEQELMGYRWVHIKELKTLIEKNLVTEPIQIYLLEQLAILHENGFTFYKDKLCQAKFTSFFNRKYSAFFPVRDEKNLLQLESKL